MGRAHDLRDAIEHRRRQQEIDEPRIELRGSSRAHRRHGFAEAPGVAIAPAVRDAVERIRDRDHARRKRDRGPHDAMRISGTVPPFVVGEHARRELRIERRQRGEHERPACGMRGNRPPVVRRQAIAIGGRVEQRVGDPADVVKERHPLDLVADRDRRARGLGEDPCVPRDPADMATRLGIGSVDRVEQCIRQRGGEPFRTPPRPSLAGDQGGPQRRGRRAQHDRRATGPIQDRMRHVPK